LKNIFLNDRHELRSGWKLLAFYVTLILLWIAAGITVVFFFLRTPFPDELTQLALNEAALFPAALVAVLLMTKFVDHRPVKTFGLTLEHWKRHLFAGLALSALMAGILLAGSYAFGYVHTAWTAGQVPAGTLIMTALVLLVAAAVEELMFRGYPLQVLCEGIGNWPGILVLSGLFGLVHLNNPNASLLGTVNTVLAGIWLSLAYIKTRSLWFPWALHVGWNAGIGFILGLPLSGLDLASLWTTGVAGSDLILGGAYGPEGGLLATFIFGTSTLIVYRKNWNPYTPPSTPESPNAAGHQPE
jgi:uncharacterized protein